MRSFEMDNEIAFVIGTLVGISSIAEMCGGILEEGDMHLYTDENYDEQLQHWAEWLI